MLYPKNKEASLSEELFRNPTKEYRGAPFWAWNCRLNKDVLKKQIRILKQMGFGGFHMHSRTGMATPYLSDDFFELVKCCVNEAKEQDMLAWAYDEDRWPSGSAGGLVTKDIRLRGKRLVLTTVPREDVQLAPQAEQTGAPVLFAQYDIVLDSDGFLKSWSEPRQGQVQGKLWYAYILTNESTPWYNGQAYVDTLNKEAMDRFIELTYEGYKNAVGEHFGTVIPAMFTDEPQFNMRTFLRYSQCEDTVELPWTMALPQYYETRTGHILKDDIPLVVWEKKNGGSGAARYRFTDCVSELFTSAFVDNCGAWCEKNGLLLSGHMMLEPTLELQSWAIGDVMRCYRRFGLPGMDILCERMEFSTAKQAQSAVHQYGREGMISELYGVTNWDYDFRGHKFQGDWQAALGVTVRVPHLSWMSMEGEAKRDYPASINYQSPWYDRYHIIEDHFARVNTAMTRGKPVVRVAVVHPTETYWLYSGPKDKTSDITRNLDKKFEEIIQWLLFHHIDFDFISESLLPEQCAEGGNPLQVGQMQYDAVVVPGCETLRSTTISRLEVFSSQGGKLIFMGRCPNRIDGCLSDGAKALYSQSTVIDYDQCQLLQQLEEFRFIRMQSGDGLTADNLLYGMRQDGENRWLFIAQGKRQWHHNPVQTKIKLQHDVVMPQSLRLTFKGVWYPSLYNTATGQITKPACHYENGDTVLLRTVYENDSLLLKLSPKPQNIPCEQSITGRAVAQHNIKTAVSYRLQEENVRLLDRAEYSLDGAVFAEEEELLRVDNLLREQLGWPLRQKKIAQPWSIPPERPVHRLKLRFKVESEITLENLYLAMEQSEQAVVTWNGKTVSTEPDGWFVDEAIKKLKLPGLLAGTNILTVELPYVQRGSLEWLYLLGEFGVRVTGAEQTIVAKPERIGFGDISRQGMPFYGGNVEYETEVEVPECDFVSIQATHYRGTFITVLVDGVEQGDILFAPYELKLPLKKGMHKITFRLYGNRHNTFGALHNANSATYYYGPDAWRTQDDAWSYEYQIRDFGILKSPVFTFCKK